MGDWRLTTTEKKAHPAEQHPRRGHRRAGGGSDQAEPAPEGAGRRKRTVDAGLRARAARPGREHQVRQLADRAGLLRRPPIGIGLFDEEEQYRVNAFDWKKEFGQVFVQGGFDAVIGNPPYIRIQAMKEWAPTEVEFYKERYRAASKGNYDIYVVFVEKALSVLNKNGMLGFILPHKFFNAKYGELVRDVISQGNHLSKIVHFGDQQVFSGATTYTCLLFLEKAGRDDFQFEKVHDLDKWHDFIRQTSEISETSEVLTAGEIGADRVTEAEWNFVVGKGSRLFEKLTEMPVKLADLADRIYQGPITSADKVYLFKDFKENNKQTISVFSKEIGSWFDIEKSILRKVVRSGSIGQYWAKTTAYVLFPYVIKDCDATLRNVQFKMSHLGFQRWTHI